MGHEAAATLRFAGKSSTGKALLVTTELICRGPSRLVIPLKDVTAATARDGVLRLTFAGKAAELTIGDGAEKWAKRILNPPSRLDKLGVKAGMTVVLSGLRDAAFAAELEAAGATVLRRLPQGARCADIIFYGAEHRDALAALADLRARIVPAGAIWVIRPKGSRDITEAETMAAGKRAGLVDVKVVAFSATHTSEKYVIPVAQRG
jgi:hypothetical protein